MPLKDRYSYKECPECGGRDLNTRYDAIVYANHEHKPDGSIKETIYHVEDLTQEYETTCPCGWSSRKESD